MAVAFSFQPGSFSLIPAFCRKFFPLVAVFPAVSPLLTTDADVLVRASQQPGHAFQA